jgi:hypothetical protein
MRGILATRGQPARLATALTSAEVKYLLASCSTDVAGLQDKALLLVDFAACSGARNRWGSITSTCASSQKACSTLSALQARPGGRGAQPVFGHLRSMSGASLKKFDADGYLPKAERLSAGKRAGAMPFRIQ